MDHPVSYPCCILLWDIATVHGTIQRQCLPNQTALKGLYSTTINQVSGRFTRSGVVMITIRELVSNYAFVKTIFDALPCGLMVIDGEGLILTINSVMQDVFGIKADSVAGKPFGYALGCPTAIENPGSCGFISDCQICAVRELAVISISKNQKQKTNTSFTVSAKGQVRDIPLSIKVLPLIFAKKQFAILILEHLRSIDSTSMIEMRDGYRGILGDSVIMRELFETIKQIGQNDAHVLVQGESGTGKELVALALHKESLRTQKNFVPVNCGALPEGLLESELFGHVKGAFTGADRAKKGRFAVANGGTLFLDEVGELSPAIQVKFLRVLQNGCFEPVGSDRTTCVDVRIISATNSRLDKETKEGRFRKDLYYRLSVMPITVPPLRARKEDVPILCDYFLTEFSTNSWTQKVTMSPEVENILMNYSWPGNVRELRNVLEYASVRTTSDAITPADLPPNLNPFNPLKKTYKKKRKLKLTDAQVTEALEMAGSNKRDAAKILGVSRSTLYRFFDRNDDINSL
jgi:transcriptional regulator with PAS, ATPase and Fis domain